MKMRNMIVIALAASLITVPLLLSSQDEWEITTIAQARELPDDTEVMLEGFVVEGVNDEHYIFRDASDEIELEIKDHHWGDREMDPMQMIRIRGEVDRDDDSFEIEVEELIFPE